MRGHAEIIFTFSPNLSAAAAAALAPGRRGPGERRAPPWRRLRAAAATRTRDRPARRDGTARTHAPSTAGRVQTVGRYERDVPSAAVYYRHERAVTNPERARTHALRHVTWRSRHNPSVVVTGRLRFDKHVRNMIRYRPPGSLRQQWVTDNGRV